MTDTRVATILPDGSVSVCAIVEPFDLTNLPGWFVKESIKDIFGYIDYCMCSMLERKNFYHRDWQVVLSKLYVSFTCFRGCPITPEDFLRKHFPSADDSFDRFVAATNFKREYMNLVRNFFAVDTADGTADGTAGGTED